MNQVFVLNAALYSHDGAAAVTALANINDLDDGSIAFFQENGVKVTDGGAFVKTDQYCTLYMGRGVDWVQKATRINMATLTSKKQAYVAPVASVKHVGYNGASGSYNLNATSKQGSYYGIAVIDLSKPVDERRKFEVTLTTLVDDITAAVVTSSLITALNADPNVMAIVGSVVTEGTAGVQFNGVAGKGFEVYGTGLIESATQTDDGNFKTGANTYEWAKELEYNESTVEGRSSALVPAPDDGFKLPARVVSGASYTVYTLAWEWIREGYSSPNANPFTHESVLMVPAANATMIASIDAILSDITPEGVAADAEARIVALENP